MLLVQSERNALLTALSAVVGVVERRHTLPILSNLLLEKKGDTLTLLATDLELQVSTHLDAQAGEDFAITIAARKLFDIVRALPEAAKVKLDTKDSQVVLSAGKSRFTLQTLPAADFPRVETGAGLGEPIQLPQKTLKRLLQLVQFAMASQDIRYYLNGMLLVLDGKHLRVVATDGHRLSYAETELETAAEAREVIIPRKTVLELSKLLGEVDDAVELRIGTNQVTITLPGTELVTKVVDGKLPRLPARDSGQSAASFESQSPERDSGIAACSHSLEREISRRASGDERKHAGCRMQQQRTGRSGGRDRSQLQQRSAGCRIQCDLPVWMV